MVSPEKREYRAVTVFCLATLALFVLIMNSSLNAVVGSESFPISNEQPCVQYISAQSIDNITDVESFLNDYISQQMSRYHIRGAHLSLVKNESLYFSSGYGYYKTESDWTPVMANSTLFHVGSLSKAITATAVMQLVEQGLIDLNEDVNEYIDAFKVPGTFAEPITVGHLLSHTSGLGTTLVPVYVYSADELPSLEQILSTELPHRILPPGQAAMYSNFGYALLGYIVEQVSGESFQEYVKTNIFEPLGMHNSYFEQVLPDDVKNQLSPGYSYVFTTGFIEMPPEYAIIPPAAGLMTTAEDYGKFLIAHLNNGEFNGTSILQNASVQLMHDVHFDARPEMDGVCYGFYERDLNGLEMIGHGGVTYRFHSTEVLLLSEKIGLYVCYNTDTARSAGAELVEAFVNRYYPDVQNITPLEGYKERAHEYAGQYVTSQSFLTTAQKLEYLGSRQYEYMNVTANPDGTILVQRTVSLSLLVTYEETFVEVEEGFFRVASGTSKVMIAFLENQNGEIGYLYFSGFPPEAWIRASANESPLISLWIIQTIGMFALLCLPTLIFIELTGLFKYRASETISTKGMRLCSTGGISVSFVSLLFLSSSLLSLFAVISLFVVALLLYDYRKQHQIRSIGSVLRFVSASHFPIMGSVFLLLSTGLHEWHTLTTDLGVPASWLQITSGYYITMNNLFILLFVYLVATAILGILVIFSWTKRGGLNKSSLSNVSERILYTVLLFAAILTVMLMSQWGAFTFMI